MRKFAALLLAMALFLCSCGVPKEAGSLVDKDVAEQMFLAGLLSEDWDTETIDPDLLVSFFLVKQSGALSTNGGMDEYYDDSLQIFRFPQGVCERYITAYFDVPKEYLRLSSYYDHDTLTYNDPVAGYGGASFIDSVKTGKKGKNVLATVYCHVPADEGESNPGPLPAYIITLTQTDNGWRISSCKGASAEKA